MKPSKFILSILESLKKQERTSQLRTKAKLVDFIYKSIMSKKFRKYSVTLDYQQHIRSAIANSIQKDEPIKLTVVFGGYKLWRLEESPEVDWAELFSIIYYTRWIKSILAVYKPGVWLDFYSDDVILEIMDNILKEDTEKYIKSFIKLLEFIKQYIPENFSITLNRVGDQYPSYNDFIKELEESKNKITKELNGNLPLLTPEQISLIDLNVKLKPNQSGDPKWREKVFLIHEAYARASKRRPYYRNSEKIMVANTPIKGSIAVGTTKTSVAKFWVGAGALKKLGNSYIEYIFSPKQLNSNSFKKENISIKGLESNNFKSIRLVEK